MITVFCLWFGVSAWFRHVNFFTAQFDLGNMDSVVWHTLHGKFFVLTDPTQLIQEPRQAVHADFLLLAGVPLYWIWSDPRMLMWLQIAVVASGAIPIFLLGRQWLGPRWGAGLAGLFLGYPLLLWAVIFDFHAVTLVAGIMPWAIWAMAQRRYWLYASLIFLALLAKEEIGLMVGLLGLVFFFQKRQPWISLATMVIGVGWTAAMLGWVIPAARVSGSHFALSYFSDFGSTPGQVFTGLLTKPGVLFQDIFQGSTAGYLNVLLWPVGWLAPLFGWLFLLPALPDLGINLLSTNDNLRAIFFHYAAAIAPFVIVATGYGLRWVIRQTGGGVNLRRGLAVFIGLSWVSSTMVLSPLPLTLHHTSATDVFKASPYRSAVRAIQADIRPADRVSVSNSLAPHFTQREWTWSFPLNLKNADRAIVLLGGRVEAGSQAELRQTITDLETDPDWELRLHQDQLYYFARIADAT